MHVLILVLVYQTYVCKRGPRTWNWLIPHAPDIIARYASSGILIETHEIPLTLKWGGGVTRKFKSQPGEVAVMAHGLLIIMLIYHVTVMS